MEIKELDQETIERVNNLTEDEKNFYYYDRVLNSIVSPSAARSVLLNNFVSDILSGEDCEYNENISEKFSQVQDKYKEEGLISVAFGNTLFSYYKMSEAGLFLPEKIVANRHADSLYYPNMEAMETLKLNREYFIEFGRFKLGENVVSPKKEQEFLNVFNPKLDIRIIKSNETYVCPDYLNEASIANQLCFFAEYRNLDKLVSDPDKAKKSIQEINHKEPSDNIIELTKKLNDYYFENVFGKPYDNK